jgi:hypothetical protein
MTGPTKTREQIAFRKLFPTPQAFEHAIALRMMQKQNELRALLLGKSQADWQRIFRQAFERAMAEVIEAAKDGLLVKNGQINGQPVYVVPEYLRDKNLIIPDNKTNRKKQ